MESVQDKTAAFRRQLEKIMTSSEFVGSRQLREFLIYVSEAAFEGRTYLDQVEIAERVLNRGKDFNPLDDASVRKMATLTRHRLDSYYSREGQDDLVVVSLPVRSYVPQFRERTGNGAGRHVEETKPIVQEPPPRAVVPHRPWRAIVISCMLAAGIVSAGYYFSEFRRSSAGVFDLTSVRGDIMHETNQLPADALRLGPQIGSIDQVTVRMRFAPERATQQAGLLIFANPDAYVKLGRQFLSRVELEFGFETRGRYLKPPNTFAYDPTGQNGEPIWLSVRRAHNTFTAFVSTDGFRWTPFGNKLEMPDPIPNARVGIFALNGRSDAPPADARFDQLSIGPNFHSLQDVPLADLGLRVASTCPEPTTFDADSLILPFGTLAQSCSTELLRPVPSGDWSVSTKVDFVGSGTTAGLICQGTKGRFRLIRWDLNGGSISAEHLGHSQMNRPDFPGLPPVILRFESRNGRIRGSFSRDNIKFQTIPLNVPLEALGDRIEVGIHAGKSIWGSRAVPPPPRFFYLHEEVRRLHNFQ